MGVAGLMFLVLFLLGILTLVLAGLGRLTAVVLMTLLGRRPGKRGYAGSRGAPDRQAAKPRKPLRDRATALKPARVKESLRTAVERRPKLAPEPQVLAGDWASAVAEADKRAEARARAAAPQIKLSVRDLPDPAIPADKVSEVAPLVESALHNHRPPHELPRSFKKPQPLHPVPPLDTGSLVSLAGPQKVRKEQAKENG
nr:hypothetical protein [Pseudarthrobacter sp. C4D7]